MTDKTVTDQLAEIFFLNCRGLTADVDLVSECWDEIREAYSAPSRHYHTLQHLKTMHDLLAKVLSEITDPFSLRFALFYHDIVYKPLKSDNEEKSAERAESRLRKLDVSPPLIQRTCQLILHTRHHHYAEEHDLNLFGDADLAILGSPWGEYQIYSKAIRQEYSLVPEFIYRPGRRKVLLHFLQMDSIFKTGSFRERFEDQARINLETELQSLR